jgi:5-methylcytosine-specific restriction endonuclease McrA
MDSFISTATEQEIKKEKNKARDLRKTQWWKQKRSKGRCYYCNRETLPQKLTMDHIVPIVRRGKSTKNNIVPACKKCNNKKKNSLPMEWADYLERLRDEKID